MFDNHQDYLDRCGAKALVPEMDRPRVSVQRLPPDSIKRRLGIASPRADRNHQHSA